MTATGSKELWPRWREASGSRYLAAQVVPLAGTSLRQIDFLGALVLSVVGAVLTIIRPELQSQVIANSATLLGVLLGAVLAGVAIQAAFMDESFLRAVNGIGEDPVKYMRPFLFTAVLAVGGIVVSIFGSMMLPPFSFVPAFVGRILVGIGTFGTLLPTLWCLLSLLPCLGVLVQFIGLKSDAALVGRDGDSPDGSSS